MRATLLQDVIALASESYPFPNFSDPAAVKTWVGTLAQGVTQVVYDAITTDQAPAAHYQALQQASLGSFSDEEIEDAFAAVKAGGKLAAAPVEKLGDGTILNFLKSIDWAQLIQTVITIIGVIPKAS
jgi:hypothetical protein